MTTPSAARWALSDAATWPPPDPPLNSVVGVAVNRDGVYAFDTGKHTLLRLGAEQTVETIATFDDPLTGPIAAAASGAVYVADTSGNRVFVVHPAAARKGDIGDGSPVPWWPFVAAGAVVVVVGGLLILRRARRAG